MSNTNAGTPPAQTTGATGASGSTQQNASAEQNGNSTTGAEDKIATLEKTVNSLAAAFRRMQEQKPNQGTNTSSGEGTSTNQQAEKSLQDRLKAAETVLERGQRRLRDAAISDAAREAGVPADRLKAFKTLIEADYGSKLKLTDDDNVVYEEFEGVETKPVSSLIAEFLKKPEGQMFRPAVATSGSKGLRPGQTTGGGSNLRYSELPEAERLKLSPAEALRMIQAEMSGS